MKRLILCLTLAAFVVLPEINLDARGRGGGGFSRGGGGGFSRGGGGMSRPAPRPSRPSTPSFNRPSPRPSTPSFNRPSPRPSTPSPPFDASEHSLASIDSPKHPLATDNEAEYTFSTIDSSEHSPQALHNVPRSNQGLALPSPTPELDQARSREPGRDPELGQEHYRGQARDLGRYRERAHVLAHFPGTGTRPGTLPGTGTRPGTRPGMGDKLQRPAQLPNRPSIGDRHNNLNNRFGDRTNININNRQEINNRWNNNRDRWGNRWNDRHWYHHHWHHGHCHWGWRPGYMWNRYPVLTAFGVTTWAINRWNWATGYSAYSNPYATTTVIDQSSTYYDYSQPIQEVESYPETAADGTTPAPDVPEEAVTTFDRALQEFKSDQFQTALTSVNEALKEMPNDAAVHEFRALVLFAIGRYDDAAAPLYAVLGVGPGWDWTTMISLYSASDVYTEQLRKLEAFTKSNPNDAAARFVLAYHYITQGHEDAAAKQLTEVVKLQPKDPLARDLLLGMDPDANIPTPKVVDPPKPTEKVTSEQIEGTWTAQRATGEKFTMALKDDGEFTWAYEGGGGQKSEVDGVWAVDDDGILALDMGEEDNIVAQLNPQGGNSLDFYIVGDTSGAEPLKFTK